MFVFLVLVCVVASQARQIPEDCDAMASCNLTTVAASQGSQFTEMNETKKLEVCRAVKLSLDCSGLYSCQRQERLLNGSRLFYNYLCRKILEDNGVPTENCIQTNHDNARKSCENHLTKIRDIINEVSPKEEMTRSACCDYQEYENCYQKEMGNACPIGTSIVLTSPERQFSRFCSSIRSVTNCREQREVASNSLPEKAAKIRDSSVSSSTSKSSIFVVTSLLLFKIIC